eukprot:5166893-Lingulodinium_polyedra.AAC.1
MPEISLARTASATWALLPICIWIRPFPFDRGLPHAADRASLYGWRADIRARFGRPEPKCTHALFRRQRP